MTTDISVAVRWDPVNQQELDDYDYDGGNSSSRLFERSRIKALADEREAVQKKTFCKWVNSHLVRANCRIADLYTDLRDGKMLIKLLEILSGERLEVKFLTNNVDGTSTYECPNIRVFRDTSRRASDFLLLVTSEIRDTSPVRFGSVR
ncbi:spectrin beta chain [Caerostris darwini]|uniref:Spectrin beta chain n=1 Tax=Caerostris darwini TaxID=1538125 RepID=A0AAV4SM66_9ARAC|nr:spectrin beta chain [Caerostris darwini]